MAGPSYNASSALTVTNLHSLASDQNFLAGWFSASTSNTTNKYLDYHYGGTFTTHASNRQAGYIYVYVVASLNDTPTWPATATGTLGTEGTGSFVDTEERDSLCRLLVPPIAVDTSVSAIYTFPQTSICAALGLIMPPTHHGLFITQNCATTTAAGLASAGSAIYQTAIVSP
jgi:hypothetical protein